MTLAKTSSDLLALSVSLVLAVVLTVILLLDRSGDPTGSDSGSIVNAVAGTGQTVPAAPVPTTAALTLPVTPDDAADAAFDAPESATFSPPSPTIAFTNLDGSSVVPIEASVDPTSSPTSSDANVVAVVDQAASAGPGTPAAVVAVADQAVSAAPSTERVAAVDTTKPAVSAVNAQPAAAAASAAPESTNSQPAVTAAAVPADAPAGGTFTHTLTATAARPSLHTAPGGPIFMPAFNGVSLPAVNPTVFGNPLVYRVLAGEPGDAWAKVYVPARPNGTTAWVQTSQFNWGSSNRLLQINVTNRTVTVFEGSNVLVSTSAVLGASSSPTPLASGWVEETMAGPSSAYGPTLISLGIYSDALNSFAGSVPKIALHGTPNPSLMGQYASNGCIRVPNELITQIAGLMPPGSKVEIVG